MRALIWNGENLAPDPSYPTPKTAGTMALVRVRLAGICSTDLQIFRGYMGFRGVPGHEFVGEVKEGPAELLGRRVVGEINFACGRCEYCGRGMGRHCQVRRVMGILGADGCFAEFIAVPAANLHVVPDSVEDREAVFVEPLAAAFEILEQVHLKPADDVIVFGDGKLGLLCAQALNFAPARVTIVGKHQNKLAHLKHLGISTVLASKWKQRQADVVVEATGSAEGLSQAIQCVRPRGTLVLKSTVAQEHTLSLAPLVINEITVVGSRCGRFAPALRALAQRSVAVTSLIDKTFPLEDGVEAVGYASRRGALKVLLRP